VKERGRSAWRRRTAAASAKLHPYRGVLAALLVAAALAALSSIGFAGVSASLAGYGYGYGYGYEYNEAHLIVIKHVVNDDGGSATASQFTMTIGGVTATGGNSFPGADSPGTDKVVTPGSYSVTETGPNGYTATFSSGCTGTIALGETKTCTVTNNDNPAHLVVIKHVINNDSGQATASQFTMTITGVTATGGNSFPGAESPGTTKQVTPGSFGVTEVGPSGYFSTFIGCTGTIALGETKTCTVTNNDVGPRRTPGYWKTHPEAITLGLTLGNYTVATTADALAVFDAMNCSGSKANDTVGCLAGQLLAAKLNLANGNSTCIQPTVNKADTFLSGGTVTVNGITTAGITYTGPSGTYNLTANQRAVAESLKNALEKYNNGAKSCTNP
jgi:Prealbumin-like fold domain